MECLTLTFIYDMESTGTESWDKMAWWWRFPMMNIVKQVPEKKITTRKNLIEMRQIILHNPKFDLKISLDTLVQLTMSFLLVSTAWNLIVRRSWLTRKFSLITVFLEKEMSLKMRLEYEIIDSGYLQTVLV